MNESPKLPSRFRWRALTSVLITAAFLVLAVSGIILFISPPGRVANWTNWGIFGLRKSEWAGLHIIFSSLFLLAAGVHIFFNWRPLLGYFRSRWNEASGMRWEWVAALAIACGIYWGTRAGVPPFSTLIAWSETIRESWESPRERAPIPHAELLTLKELADKAAVDFAIAASRETPPQASSSRVAASGAAAGSGEIPWDDSAAKISPLRSARAVSAPNSVESSHFPTQDREPDVRNAESTVLAEMHGGILDIRG
jgi:hypothetical protein